VRKKKASVGKPDTSWRSSQRENRRKKRLMGEIRTLGGRESEKGGLPTERGERTTPTKVDRCQGGAENSGQQVVRHQERDSKKRSSSERYALIKISGRLDRGWARGRVVNQVLGIEQGGKTAQTFEEGRSSMHQ